MLLKGWINAKRQSGWAEGNPQVENVALLSFRSWPILPMGSVFCCWRNHSTSSSGCKHMGLRWYSVRKPVGRWGRVQQGIVSTRNPASPSALDSNTKTFSHHIPIEMMEIQTSLKKQPSLKFLFKFYLTLPLQVPFPREYFFNMKKITFSTLIATYTCFLQKQMCQSCPSNSSSIIWQTLLLHLSASCC